MPLVALCLCLTLAGMAQPKIWGLSVVAPPSPNQPEVWDDIKNIGAKSIALMPYAYMRTNDSTVFFDNNRQYWGESTEGTQSLIRDGHKQGLSIMLKPHLWIMPNTYTGQLSFSESSMWKHWAKAYQKYIWHFAELAEKEGVEIFCVATEMQSFWQEHPRGFLDLVAGVRQRFSGQITYAANWDEYERFPFWALFDRIGIDAYFPVNPKHVKQSMKTTLTELETFAEQKNKHILFTEWGFRSIDDPYSQPWESGGNHSSNEKIQAEAYAIFLELWHKSTVFDGVFVWKWFIDGRQSERRAQGFTPQGKAAETVLRQYFKP